MKPFLASVSCQGEKAQTLIGGEHIGTAILFSYVCVFSHFSYQLIGFVFIFA
jgi:hypothetical protein